MANRKNRVSMIGPVILIGLGVVLLLNNLEVLPWSIWGALFRLWPVLLVAVGLEAGSVHQQIERVSGVSAADR